MVWCSELEGIIFSVGNGVRVGFSVLSSSFMELSSGSLTVIPIDEDDDGYVEANLKCCVKDVSSRCALFDALSLVVYISLCYQYLTASGVCFMIMLCGYVG